MFEEAVQAVAESSEESKVYIGCDSQRFKREVRGKTQYFARYTTVIVIHKDGRHGCKIYYDNQVLPDFGKKTEGLVPRLLNETSFAIAAYEEILPVLGDRHIEIHLDINNSELHASNAAAQQAIGYVLGSTGIKPAIKPFGWAATHAADHCVKGKLH